MRSYFPRNPHASHIGYRVIKLFSSLLVATFHHAPSLWRISSACRDELHCSLVERQKVIPTLVQNLASTICNMTWWGDIWTYFTWMDRVGKEGTTKEHWRLSVSIECTWTGCLLWWREG